MSRPRVMTIVGTRPDVIKMAPVIREMNGREAILEHVLVATAQHREMLDQVMSLFKIRPDIDLNLMQHDQSLAEFSARSLKELSRTVSEVKPDILLVQGDTTTAMTAALAAFYQGIPVGHVEAGLRSCDIRNPFPEELNRRVLSCLAEMHFAPTQLACTNLLDEGVRDDRIHLTGNTIIDALVSILSHIEGKFDHERLDDFDFENKRIILVTAHRRENHGAPLRAICRALKMLVSKFEDVEIIYPVHLNPKVGALVHRELDDIIGIHLVDPVSYSDLLRLMNRCYLILTDSGGIQEEAPFLHKPVLILRETTERPEVVLVGAGKVIGTDATRIFNETAKLLNDPELHRKMSEAENPFGDGHAAERIVNIIQQRLCSTVIPA